MNRLLTVVLASMLAMGAAGSSGTALAAETEADEEGFSAYSVARMKIFQGTAWIRTPDSGEWEETTTNTPITEKSRVNIPEGSEAELQFHGGQFVLLTGGTEVDVTMLNESKSSFRLRSGEIRFDLPAEDFSPVGVIVPGGGRTEFGVPGRYWLIAQADATTRLVVRSGDGVVTAAGGVHSVKVGQAGPIGQGVGSGGYEGKVEEPPPDDAALTEEERQAEVPPAAAYELRDYGDWVYSEEYGWVWQPRVAAGWEPYYYGRWTWVSPYGWTWVGYEPWGWYPYHYGWWASDPYWGWVWAPYHSFVSVGFFFGHSHFVHHHGSAVFFPANARFVRDGRTVRYVPLRPGERFVRSGLTRSDARLAGVNRPLERGSVFVRSAERGGKSEWREWSSARKDHRTVKVREGGTRTGDQDVRRSGQGRGDRSTIRTERDRSGPDRREVTQPRGQDRPNRTQEREFRGRGGRGSSLGDGEQRRDARDPSIGRERTGPSRSERVWRRAPSNSDQIGRDGPPRRTEAPTQVRERREAPSGWSGRSRASPPAREYAPRGGGGRADYGPRNSSPGRSYQPSGRDAGRPEYAPRSSAPGRGDFRGQSFQDPRYEGSFGGGGGRGAVPQGRGEFGGQSFQSQSPRSGGSFGGGGGRGGGQGFNFVGTVVGAGIFRMPPLVAGNAGSENAVM